MKKAFILLCVLLWGCATLTRGTNEVLIINSEPSGAFVTVEKDSNIIFSGTAPTSCSLSRSGGYIIYFEKKGYEKVTTIISSQMADSGGVALAGNCLYGGCLGAGIDAASGAAKELKPNPINVKLTPLDK